MTDWTDDGATRIISSCRFRGESTSDMTNTEKHEEMLRARARERVEAGVLPRAKPARSWGGHGSGLPCSLCDLPIAANTTEMELEFDGAVSATSVRFHLQCQSIWESVRRAPIDTDWIALEKRLPPFDTVVEARLDLGGSKSVILGVVRARDGPVKRSG